MVPLPGGVLDRLLEEKYLGFEGLSATSAGAMNAAVFAYGLAVDGRDGARNALAGYWKRVSDAASLGPLHPSPIGPDARRSQASVVASFLPDGFRDARAVSI